MERIWREILHMFEVAADGCVKDVSRSPPNRKPKHWWNDDLSGLLRSYRRARRHYLRHRSDAAARAAHKAAKRAFHSAVSNAKRDSWYTGVCAAVESNDHRVQWSAFQRSKGSARVHIDSIANADGSVPHSPQQAANNLAAHFAHVCSIPADVAGNPNVEEECRATVSRLAASRAFDPVFDTSFTAEDVRAVCAVSRLSAAVGPDRIPAHFLRHASDGMVEALTRCFNFSWHHAVLPQDWRSADVRPLYKGKGATSDPDSYRPISLTSLVVKAMERLVLGRLVKQLESKLHVAQCGFRRKHACFDNIYALLTAIRRRWLSRQPTGQQHRRILSAVFLDFSKAFDRTWHDGLLHKLAGLGVTGRAWRWVHAFLSGRQLRVVQGALLSAWFPISAGVPQGSVISPFLFLVYINDLTERLSSLCEVLLYADDVVLWLKEERIGGDPNLMDVWLEEAMRVVLVWCFDWKMNLNARKSAIMRFNRTRLRRTEPLSVSVRVVARDGESAHELKICIPFAREYRYLGVLLHDRLHWQPHVTQVLARLRSESHYISRLLRVDLPPSHSTIRTLVRAILLPIVSYGLPLWVPTASQATRLSNAMGRPLVRSLGLPLNAPHIAAIVESALPDVTALSHKAALQAFLRIIRLPFDHPSYRLLNCEEAQLPGFACDGVDVKAVQKAKRHPLPLLSCVLPALRALLPHSDLPNPRLLLDGETVCVEEAKKPNRLAVAETFRRWIESEGNGRFLKQLYNAAHHSRLPRMPLYLSTDPVSVARMRARFRFDRTSLLEPRSRHSRIPVADTQCPRCHQEADTAEHYLLRCGSERMRVARTQALTALWRPSATELPAASAAAPGSLVAFTDGSCDPSTRRAGSAAILCVPSSQRTPTSTRSRPSMDPLKVSWRDRSGDWSGLVTHIANGTNNVAELMAIHLACVLVRTHCGSAAAAAAAAAAARAAAAHTPPPAPARTRTLTHTLSAASPPQPTPVESSRPLVIFTDSKYCVGVLARGWVPQGNATLVNAVLASLASLSRPVHLCWVKAHDATRTPPGNVFVDAQSRAAMLDPSLQLSPSTRLKLPALPDSSRLSLDVDTHSVNSVPAYTLPVAMDSVSVRQLLGADLESLGKADQLRSLEGSATYLQHLMAVRRV
jgi:ribonuclease HI